MPRPALGVCYYPEHWPEEGWPEDAQRMADLGLTYVRIGEFAWSRLEPAAGAYDFDWLQRAIDTLAEAGLKVVLGTPTATPPKWLIDANPEMLPVGADGRMRTFGSRRHYCFSHDGYRDACRRIVTKLADAFGRNPAVVAWQIDNEYGCHDTTLSYTEAARTGFRAWLNRKYQSPDALNRAWGNVFWSMEVTSFDEIDLPNATVTEANPSHWMDFRQYSSDQVVRFNQIQVDVLRRLSPGRPLIHNFMGRTLDFDHFDVGADLDISSWDSYPLGFLEDRSDQPDDWKRRFARTGDPDFQAFHHDLYRATSGGRWWVMEQQPGPVNWAPHNPAPRDGMVRLWTLEAVAHGAEVVSYFRWRQAPFAQEQMHAGLLRPDGVRAPGYEEAAQALRDLNALPPMDDVQAPVAIVIDYPSAWAWQIQPQGASFDYFRLVFDLYRGLRRKGLSIDLIPAATNSFNGYRLVVIPGLFAWTANLRTAIAEYDGHLLIGPRAGSKTPNFAIPASMPPDLPTGILDATVTRVESLRDDLPITVGNGAFRFWREFLETGPDATAVIESEDGHPALIRQENRYYLAGWPDDTLLADVIQRLGSDAGLPMLEIPDGVRIRHNGDLTFVINYGDQPFPLETLGPAGDPLIGSSPLGPADVAVFLL